MPLSELFDPSPSEETPLACDLSALGDPEEHSRRSEALFAEREDVQEIGGGYAFRYPGTMDYAERILGFVNRERQCCPFLTFEIVFEPEGRGIWLYLGGGERVEAYLRRQFKAQGL